MKFALLVCFCLLMANAAEGMLRAEPSISSVAIDAHDPDVSVESSSRPLALVV